MADLKEFKCNISREVFSSDNFKIYGVEVDVNAYPDIILNQYGNATIVGNIHTLVDGVEYTVSGKETDSKFGKQYEVVNIKREKPTGKMETEKFLREVISESQADVLLNVYPNIVEKVINNDLVDIDLTKTKGIKAKTFSKIAEKIIENFGLVEIMEKYGGYGLSMNVLKKLYEQHASIEKLEEELQRDPYKSLCKISGISFKKADNIILSIPSEVLGFGKDIKKSRQRMLSAMHFILEENEKDGNTKMAIEDFTDMCIELTPECTSHFTSIIKEDTHFYFSEEQRVIARQQAYNAELYIATTLTDMLKNNKIYEFAYEDYQNNEDIRLTDEQLQALEYMCRYNVSLLAGSAGSGKSSTVKSIINMLDNYGLKSILMTPTGKSSAVLQDSSGRKASTIHRGLGFNPEKKDKWKYNEDNKLDCDVVIIDETGMVDIYLLRRLLLAVDTSKTKLLFIQDPAQLPSVSSGNCSDDMIKSLRIPTTTLTTIFRYAEGGLYNVATKIRNGENYIPKTDESVINFGKSKDYSIVDVEQELMVDNVVELYRRLINQGNTPDDIMVLSHHNKGSYGTIELNNAIQKKINPINHNTKFIKSGNTNFIVGDKVLQVVNNYKAKTKSDEEVSVFNGNTGIVKQIDMTKKEVFVDFGDELIKYNTDTLSQLILGYAVSIHRSQGDSAKYVIVLTPRAHTFFLNRNLIYTAVTRTKTKCFHVTSKDTVKSAIRKSIPKQRKTFLKELLKQCK